MDQNNPKAQVVDRIRQAQNVLVTVSADPSVDQLAAAIGLTVLLNKMGKHGTAVFSGQVPSTIEFLEPEKTLEKNTDSLRDFIIALDKAKADKLRYKVEENVVKIFITPYKTSLSEADLNFSQGDFNVDVVVALGVHDQAQLDQAITSHGRILHDATVVSIANSTGGELGSINWQEVSASSLSEMVVTLADALDKTMMDSQIATALLTGIVAETNRFSNEKTTPTTMSVSSELMAAGANQQLVATKLQEPAAPPPEIRDNGPDEPSAAPSQSPPEPPKPNDGELDIDHSHDKPAEPSEPSTKTENAEEKSDTGTTKVHIDEDGQLHIPEPGQTEPRIGKAVAEGESATTEPAPSDSSKASPLSSSHMVIQPPSLGGTLTANSRPQDLEPSTDPMTTAAKDQPILKRDSSGGSASLPKPADMAPSLTLPEPEAKPTEAKAIEPEATLASIEESVHSPHVAAQNQPNPLTQTPPSTAETSGSSGTESSVASGDIDKARDAVQAAIASSAEPAALPPIEALNAQPVFDDLHGQENSSGTEFQPPLPDGTLPSVSTAAADTGVPPLPGSPSPSPAPMGDTTSSVAPGGSLTMPTPPPTFPSNLAPPSPSAGNPIVSPTAPPPVPPPMMPFPPSGQ